MPGLWICLWFGISQGSGYNGSKYAKVTQGSKYSE